MANFSISGCSPAICTTKIRCDGAGVQVQGAVLSEPVSRQLPVNRAVLNRNRFSESRKSLAGICQTSRLFCSGVNPQISPQFVVRAAVADDSRAQSSPRVSAQFDEQPGPPEETESPSREQSETEQDREEANEPLRIGEENSLPFGPAGGLQYDERDPQTELAEAESKEDGITVEDAHLMPLPVNSVTDFGRNQERGWSESSCDEGSAISAAADVRRGRDTSGGGSQELLIERLLESLPLYDWGRSPEQYRIRALVYGKIGDYFSKGEGRAQQYGVLDDNHGAATDVKALTAVQQLADLILAEDGRTAADYNCRAQFFQKSAEMFSGGGDGKRTEDSTAGKEETGEQKMGRVLQQLEDVMLSDSGRSAADYNRRANVFGKTADALSAGFSGAASCSKK